jgi:hydroxymethylbilane synthase
MNTVMGRANGPGIELVVGTRKSALAMWQTNHVIERLAARHSQLRLRTLSLETRGDQVLDVPLPQIGGKGVFTAELDRGLLEGNIDLAVHSLKDLPTQLPAGLKIGAILARDEPRDVLVCPLRWDMDHLPMGAVVGTSSLRRQAQLLRMRRDLNIKFIRGNVPTRIAKAIDGEYDAIVLAGAGVLRLGLSEHIAQWFPLDLMLPAPGQGALAVTCRDDDSHLDSWLASIHDPVVAACVTAERHLLAALGGGCSAPIAAFAAELPERHGHLKLIGRVVSPDGTQAFTGEIIGRDPSEMGRSLANLLLAGGADQVLKDWRGSGFTKDG